MGRCESASVYIGVKFKIKELIEYLKDKNEEKLLDILNSEHLYVIDDNNEFNSVFKTIRESSDLDKFISDLKYYGNKDLIRYDGDEQITFNEYDSNNNCLYNQDFVYVDDNSMLTNIDRWGYNRSGDNVNCSEIPSFVKIEKIKKKLGKNFTKLEFNKFTFMMTTILYAG